MHLLVGLGNPGTEYEHTRHNAGFMAVDACINAYRLTALDTKFNAICYKGQVGAYPVIALKPQTYMNKSGRSVLAAAQFYKILPQHIIVFHDELDLTLAKCRIKCGGGHGGHNGLRDIDAMLGTDYWRVRLGIDRPLHKAQVTSYVLHDFTKDERAAMDKLNDTLSRHLPLLLAAEAEKTMTAVALDMQG